MPRLFLFLLGLLIPLAAGTSSLALADAAAVARQILADEQGRIVLGSGDPRKLKPRTNTLPAEYRPENGKSFPLASYWVDQSTFRAVEGAGLSETLASLFSREKGGRRQYRLFVHPLSESFYAPLVKGAERAEDFVASPTASNRSLVVWPKNEESSFFIAKVSLAAEVGGVDRTVKSSEVTASLGVNDILHGAELPENFHYMPETFGLLPSGQDRGGMILREVPPAWREGKTRYVPLFALYGGSKQEPLILEQIRASGETPRTFVRERIVKPFLDQWTKLVIREGISMEPHGQNLLIGLDEKGMPNGQFLHRDFGGFNIDLRYRNARALPMPAALPFVGNLDENYYQAAHAKQLFGSLGTYFEGSFLWDLERHLIQWQKEGRLPASPRLREGELTDEIWRAFAGSYAKQTGRPAPDWQRLAAYDPGNRDRMAALIRDAREDLSAKGDKTRARRNGAGGACATDFQKFARAP